MATEYDKVTEFSDIKKPSNHIGADDKQHQGAYLKASGCMPESIGVDDKPHRGGWTKKKRMVGITQSRFRSLPRSEQFKYANRYLNMRDKDFDDGTFAFSVTTFKKLCEELGFAKIVTDTRATSADAQKRAHVIELPRSKREHTIEKKLRLSTDTVELMASAVTDKMTNEEKSKVIDIIIREAFTKVASEREAGRLRIEYKEKHKAKEVRNVLL